VALVRVAPHRNEQVTAILGEPPDFLLAKIGDRVDASAPGFIAQSPLAFLATIDRDDASSIAVRP
jgi:predicted pyridoxine 5'-phosphate oxidase superfamily flavin-nucleotide-binding protein